MTDVASCVPLSVTHGTLVGRVLRMYQVHTSEAHFAESVSDFMRRMFVHNRWIPTLTFRKLHVFFERHYEKKAGWALSEKDMFNRIKAACVPGRRARASGGGGAAGR